MEIERQVDHMVETGIIQKRPPGITLSMFPIISLKEAMGGGGGGGGGTSHGQMGSRATPRPYFPMFTDE
jgi:hypothetical protein